MKEPLNPNFSCAFFDHPYHIRLTVFVILQTQIPKKGQKWGILGKISEYFRIWEGKKIDFLHEFRYFNPAIVIKIILLEGLKC